MTKQCCNKLKLIKCYLRSKINDQRLNALITLSCEKTQQIVWIYLKHRRVRLCRNNFNKTNNILFEIKKNRCNYYNSFLILYVVL